MKVYRIGKSIILPHVRYVNHGGRKTMLMFHSEVLRINGKYKTLGCDKMDDSGFCLGHEISRKEFLERYCGGDGNGNNRKNGDKKINLKISQTSDRLLCVDNQGRKSRKKIR
ncbi:MAG: hypothetical protein AB1638_06500 [Nitrospirota bacterium]